MRVCKKTLYVFLFYSEKFKRGIMLHDILILYQPTLIASKNS